MIRYYDIGGADDSTCVNLKIGIAISPPADVFKTINPAELTPAI
jgi:hypothetical protein